MRTTFELEDIIWDYLNASSLKSSVSGGIYKRKRPAGSSKEDVVIISLPVNNQQIQSAIVNVNIHVPNLVIKSGNVQDDSQPNHQRLNDLGAEAVDLLTDKWGFDYNFDVQQQTLIEDENGKSHYINIRLDFYSINF